MGGKNKLQKFRHVPQTGVIYVMSMAAKAGYTSGSPDWSNLGQGQPEIGSLKGAPSRVENVPVLEQDLEYAPVSGLSELRKAVAEYYNFYYRKNKKSKYTEENIAIVSGGRLALTRAVATLGNINVGHFLPDYTAYEELLNSFNTFSTIPIPLSPDKNYKISEEELYKEITGKGLSAILLSNPCNPTGSLICGKDLKKWCKMSRNLDCAMLFDEFYGHYIWSDDIDDNMPGLSAASHVKNVNKEQVIIFDGLTKNWRYPGWRIAWVLGPKDVIKNLSSAGSFLDGGASRPMQRAAIALLDPKAALDESRAIRACFKEKRDYAKKKLLRMGVKFDCDSDGTFYLWGNVSDLPGPISTGMSFFKKALEYKVVCVPGEFFDINPGKRRPGRQGAFDRYVRFSFGPKLECIKAGIDRLSTMVDDHR